MRRMIRLAAVSLCLMLMMVTMLVAGEFRAAVARVDITPPPGVEMLGYRFRKSPATGTLDPLYARVLVLADGARNVGLVTLDLARTFGVPAMNSVRDRVRRSAAIEQVFFCASHTHSGPTVGDSYPPGGMPAWEQAALDRIGAALEEAGKRVAPARIGTGFGQTYIGHNRRRINPDGTVNMFMRNETKVPTSPVDPTVGIIRVDDDAGAPIAILVNYACHPVVLGPDNLRYSADYPGAMARTVEAAFDGRPICFFLQGGSGDINPYMDKTPLQQGAERVVIETGEQLGREAARVAKAIRTALPSRPGVHASLDVLQFKLRWDPEKMRDLRKQAYGEEMSERYLGKLSKVFNAPVMTLVVNDEIALVGMPGEPFIEFQLDLRARSPLRSAFLVGYSNGWMAYLPTIRAAVEGGYGANSLTTNLEVGAGEAMLNHALVKIYTMLGMLKDTPTR